jgi:putative acetyltransferase
MDISIRVPHGSAELNGVRNLLRSFVAWHRRRHTEDIHLIDAYFDPVAFEEELAALPGEYVPPKGRLLFATVDGAAAGCVALREVDATSCEMKRMFVYERFHGFGVGRALGEAIVEAARGLGYQRVLLDTSVRQNEAMKLYQRLGFEFARPYHEVREAMRDWLVFMELTL